MKAAPRSEEARNPIARCLVLQEYWGDDASLPPEVHEVVLDEDDLDDGVPLGPVVAVRLTVLLLDNAIEDDDFLPINSMVRQADNRTQAALSHKN